VFPLPRLQHGNKAATSSSGSADILLSLGCPVTTLPPAALSHVAAQSPFLFLFAPLYHPAMVRVAPVRKQLGFPTVFNALGPLINPAKPKAVIVGVHSKYLGPIFAEALKITGVERAWVVCGAEGLDEISPAGETFVRSPFAACGMLPCTDRQSFVYPLRSGI
jgi:anthranilate phosphoribosyltransferase